LEPIVGNGLLFCRRRQVAPASTDNWPLFFQPRSYRTAHPIFSPGGPRKQHRLMAPGGANNLSATCLAGLSQADTGSEYARSLLSIDDEKPDVAGLPTSQARPRISGALLEWRDYVALLVFQRPSHSHPSVATLRRQWHVWVEALLDSRPADRQCRPRRATMLDLLRAGRKRREAVGPTPRARKSSIRSARCCRRGS